MVTLIVLDWKLDRLVNGASDNDANNLAFYHNKLGIVAGDRAVGRVPVVSAAIVS